METRRLIEALVTQMTPNATVVDVTERERIYTVTIAGTTGVVARCEIPRDLIEHTTDPDATLRRLGATLKSCADSTVATVPDGRA
jgi:hypothetical protein